MFSSVCDFEQVRTEALVENDLTKPILPETLEKLII